MMPRKLPLFDGFIETPFEHRFQGLLRESWHDHRWHDHRWPSRALARRWEFAI